MSIKILLLVVIIILFFTAFIYYLPSQKIHKISPSVTPTPPPASISVYYSCRNNKYISVVFTPKHADLTLSDGRNLSLSQVMSADGGRYANSGETFVFWSKGNGALILENNQEKSYVGCLVVAPDPGGLPQIYTDSELGFSLRYPANYSLNTGYLYDLNPVKDIKGVKFIIPVALSSGTNLSGYDTGISVESIPETPDCGANLFFSVPVSPQLITDDHKEYFFASATGAAAGNFYEEQVWALPETNPCLAVRYFIHSTNIGNYPSGTVKSYDRASLLSQFDSIRRTLVIR